MKIKVAKVLLIGLSISIFSFGCTSFYYSSECMKDGIPYGTTKGIFIGKYFDYYERGISYTEGQCFNFAILDFRSAINKRDEDTRSARTYGMHFTEYFPHRELGIVEYFLGNDLSAKNELELSLNQEFSDKALFYYKKVIDRIHEKEQIHTRPPVIQLTFPLNSVMNTNQKNMTIRGTVQSDQYISEIIIADEPYQINSLMTFIKFNKSIQLKDGKNKISILAKNIYHQEAVRNLEIIFDKSPPQIMISSVDKNHQLFGTITDRSGVKTFSVNGKKMEIPDPKKFSFILHLNQEQVEFFVEDSLGNSNIDIFNIRDLKQSKLLAFNDTSVFSDADINPKGTIAPFFKINKWMDKQSLYWDEILIKGKIIGDKPIEKFTLDLIHESGHKTNRNLLEFSKSNSCYIYFGESVSLNYGKNTLILTCQDYSGHASQEIIEITRLMPAIYSLKNRLSMEAFPFITQRIGKKGFLEQLFCIVDTKNCSPAIEGEERFQHGLFQFSFLNELLSFNRFQLSLQRQLKDAFHSMTFYLDKTTTDNDLSQKDTSLVGDIFESRYGINIVVKLIDRGSSEILSIVDLYDDHKDVNTLKKMAKELAKSLYQQFPFVSGYIETMNSDTISANFLGQSLQRTPYVLIYRNEMKYLGTTDYQIGNQSEIIGMLKILRNEQGHYMAILIDSKIAIKPGDRLYPK